MPSRRRSRQQALQVLFLMDLKKCPLDTAITDYFQRLEPEEGDEPPQLDSFTELLIRGTAAEQDAIDDLIRRHSEHWRLDRMPVVDRNILRIAAFEMSEVGTPPAVVIDEALELARRYSSPEAVAFINGVLDAIRRNRENNPTDEGH